MNTWKSPPPFHTKVDQVSVEPTAEVQEGFHLFIYFFKCVRDTNPGIIRRASG